MIEIAGGIVLAVLFLCLLPLAFILAVTVVKVLLIVAVALFIIYFVVSEPATVAIIGGTVLAAVVFFTTFAALLGIIVSRLPFIKGRYADRVSLAKPDTINYKQHLSAVYDYYHPLGLRALGVLFVAYVVVVVVAVMVQAAWTNNYS
jgi:hypothetical protein